MSNKIKYALDERQISGKKVSRLRNEGIVPGIIHVPGKDSIMVQAEYFDLKKVFDKAGETSVVYTSVGDKKTEMPLFFSKIETDPLSGKISHFVLKQVSLKEKIEAEVPIETVGEFDVSQGVLVTVRDSVVINALPTDMPNKFEVDLGKLENIGDTVNISDLDIDIKTMEVVLGEDMDPSSTPILIVQDESALAEKEEAAAEASENAETEVIGEDGAEGETEATQGDESSEKSQEKTTEESKE
jgi:large subunit ribosomal protein L25